MPTHLDCGGRLVFQYEIDREYGLFKCSECGEELWLHDTIASKDVAYQEYKDYLRRVK